MKFRDTPRRKHPIKIEFWNDWIRIGRDDSGEMYFSQSNAEEPSFNHRTIGLAKDDRDVFYVAVGIHRENKSGGKPPSKYSGRGLVAQRIKEVMSTRTVPASAKMVTMLPLNYLSFAWEDVIVCNSLFGRLDKATCLKAVEKLSEKRSPTRVFPTRR